MAEALVLPQEPFFVARHADEGGGVDYLGLRQPNLTLMDAFLPGINNVTFRIRPYAVIAWLVWTFVRTVKAQGAASVGAKEFAEYRQKVEILFGWGHQLHGAGTSMVGNAQKCPPSDGEVSLSFSAWHRNVSWLDAVSYGPSLKLDYGLGFIAQKGKDVFGFTHAGAELAKALDSRLRECTDYDRLCSLSDYGGSAAMADALYPAWAIANPSVGEISAFVSSFFQSTTIGEDTSTGRRATGLTLLVAALREANEPLNLNEIRRRVLRGVTIHATDEKSANGLDRALTLFRVLQVRQAQRLAMECLFSWVERHILAGVVDSTSLVVAMRKAIEADGSFSIGHELASLSDSAAQFAAQAVPLFQAATRLPGVDIFIQMEALELGARRESEAVPRGALRLLLLCAALAKELNSVPAAQPALELGGAFRVSLGAWSRFIDGASSLLLDEFLLKVVENYLISQHLAIAATRYQVGKQRLRLALEDTGLVSLISPRAIWHPAATPDRLASAFSLLVDCGLVSQSSDGRYGPT